MKAMITRVTGGGGSGGLGGKKRPEQQIRWARQGDSKSSCGCTCADVSACKASSLLLWRFIVCAPGGRHLEP